MQADIQEGLDQKNEANVRMIGQEEQESTESKQGLDMDEPGELLAKIEALESELAEAKDRHLRSLADIENMRRRHEKERVDLHKFATEKLLQDLLPVLDSMEKANSAASTMEGSALAEGVRMVQRQFLQVLDNNGLTVVEAAGKPFDPNFHQAIQRIESPDVTQEQVKDEFQKGYLLNGRLVRPSMVSVLVPSLQGSVEVK